MKEFIDVKEEQSILSKLKDWVEKLKGNDNPLGDIDDPIVIHMTSLSNESKENLFQSSDSKQVQDGTDTAEKIKRFPCRNEGLAGTTHPITGVPFERKIVINEKGEKVEGVFPVFESTLDVELPEDLHQASDSKQFDSCNKKLKEKVENDPEFRAKFTDEQLEQIENGDTPDGYTWHHHEDTGKMQLVDTETHNKTAHTGGKAVWGGGSENR